MRVLVVGAGHMGRLHARKVAEHARVGGAARLVGVVDPDEARGRAVAQELETRFSRDARALLEETDAVIVASPTLVHFETCARALEAGVDVLVEKPIAATLREAEDLVALAQRRGRVLQVGHQEWFNTAMRGVRRWITTPRFAEIHRLGPFTERSTDVDVVRDLMIHDIEILQQLLREEPEEVHAVGVPVLTEHVDIANARLRFSSACVANLTASRVSAAPMRRFRLFQRDAYFSIDFLEQKAAIFRRVRPEDGGAPRIEFEELKSDPGDALMAQLQLFLDAVRTGGAPRADGERGVTGAEGAAALRTALRVIEAMPPVDDLA